MVARIAKSLLAASARPRPFAATASQAASLGRVAAIRAASTTPAVEDKKTTAATTEEDTKAASILDALPGNSLVSKAAILSAGTAAAVAAISNELYVVNEESIVAVSLLTVFYGIGKFVGPLYSGWAQQQADKVKEILNAARSEHTSAVQQRISSVQELSGVVDITKTLFEVSKETAKLEAQAFELEQRTAIAAEAKSVLESWVRYEGQVKQRQQKELADSIIAKIEKDIQSPKAYRAILDQSVLDVERILLAK